jgi:hypothetical protein
VAAAGVLSAAVAGFGAKSSAAAFVFDLDFDLDFVAVSD